jgi:hypothetical protein
LDKLMDKEAKEQFRAQIEKDPPPATAENCFATLERLVEDRQSIFRRGLANAFSKLDRRFRSHDGFKIGARMVLGQMLSPDGWWNHWRHHDDTLIDVERVFAILDGKPQPERDGGIVGAIKLAKQSAGLGHSAGQFEAESDYFRVKVFKNGNAHVWFKRDDLLERVNLLLAEHYGAALGAAPTSPSRRHEPNRTPAKNLGFFETPEPVLHRLLEAAMVGTYAGVTPLMVLEPSAGLRRPRPPDARRRAPRHLHRDPARAAAELRGLHGLKRVIRGRLLRPDPGVLGRFDRRRDEPAVRPRPGRRPRHPRHELPRPRRAPGRGDERRGGVPRGPQDHRLPRSRRAHRRPLLRPPAGLLRRGRDQREHLHRHPGPGGRSEERRDRRCQMTWLYVPNCASSPSAPEEPDLTSASSWQFQALARSAWWRGKPSPSQLWSRRCSKVTG